MPQIILECSDNIVEKDVRNVLLQIHKILTEKLPTQLQSCKSRVIRHNDYLVGEGENNNAFVHLSIGVLKGRSTELLNSLATAIMPALKEAFSVSLSQLDLQITIAIHDLPEVYVKYTKQIN